MSAAYHTGYSGFTENDDVGKVKAPKFQLPPPSFTYGKALDRDLEGAGQVIRTWAFPSPSKTPPKHRDFKALNKISLRNGFHEARGIREFRKNCTAFETPKVGQKTIKIVLPEEEFVYGNPNRPSTPMTSVMNNEYGMRAALLTQEMYKTHFEESKSRNLSLPRLNNTTRLSHEKVTKRLQELNNVEQKPLFKLKKFLLTSPKVETINKGYIPASSSSRIANGESSKKL